MKTKKVFLFLVCACIALLVDAQTKITPYTRLFLKKYSQTTDTVYHSHSSFPKPSLRNGIPTIGAFIELKEGADVEEVISLGAKVCCRVGNVLTVEIPVDKITALAESDAIKQLDVEKPVKPHNDASRHLTKGEFVQDATGLKQPYTGSGVIVGICDTGFDFNHISFMDTDGRLRIKQVYMPEDNTGTSPSFELEGETFILPGSEYTAPEEISQLTTDNPNQSHGSHTLGTAAGAYLGNNFYGYATEADIVCCGMPEEALTDVNIANSIAYIFRYAESVGKPAVINVSLGGHEGAHDGTSFLPRMFDGICGKGKLISVSAGNNGGTRVHLTGQFTEKDNELKTCVCPGDFNGYVDAWSKTSSPIGVKMFAYRSYYPEKIVYETPLFFPGGEGEVVYDSSKMPELARYYQGTIAFASEINPYNGKFHVLIESELSKVESSEAAYNVLGFAFVGDAGEQVDAWVGDRYEFFSQGFGLGGDYDYSISDLATGDSTITVGAYNSKNFYKSIGGQEINYGESMPLGEISYYSSYGPDMRGVRRPDVIAPGTFVTSAVNGYDKNNVELNHGMLAAETEANGRKYYWGNMWGTSMAAPAVTGIIAQWLEADPNLTPARVKDVLKKTAIRDEYTTSENAELWGFGKIDAYAGLLEILKGITGLEAERNINKVLVSNPVDGSFQVFAPGETGKVSVNLYSPGGVLLYTTTQSDGGTVQVDAGKLRGTGINILQVTGEKTNYRTKIYLE